MVRIYKKKNFISFFFLEFMKRLIHGFLIQENYYLNSCAFLCVLKPNDMDQGQHCIYVEMFSQLLKSFFSSSSQYCKNITQETFQLFLNLLTEQHLNSQSTLLSLYSNGMLLSKYYK
jgi:hypothetical protein